MNWSLSAIVLEDEHDIDRSKILTKVILSHRP